MKLNYCFIHRYNLSFSLCVIFLLINPRIRLPFEAAIPHCSETFMSALIVTPKSFSFKVVAYLEHYLTSYYGTPFHNTSSPKLPLKHSAQRKLIHGVGMETVYVCMWQGSDSIHTHNQPIKNVCLTSYTSNK